MSVSGIGQRFLGVFGGGGSEWFAVEGVGGMAQCLGVHDEGSRVEGLGQNTATVQFRDFGIRVSDFRDSGFGVMGLHRNRRARADELHGCQLV